jgi:hypothetical protein
MEWNQKRATSVARCRRSAVRGADSADRCSWPSNLNLLGGGDFWREPPCCAREQLGGVNENGVGASAPVSLAKARDERLDVAP